MHPATWGTKSRRRKTNGYDGGCWALPLVWSLAVFADVWGVPGAVRLLGKSVVRAGQFRFDLPAVAGQPPAGRFGDCSGCGGLPVGTYQ